MKARAFIAAAAMLLIGGSAFAQSGSAGAFGSVSVPLSVASQRDMQIGDMQRGVVKTVQLGNPTANGTVSAQFRIRGDQNDLFQVTSAAATLNWVPAPGQVAGVGDVTTMAGANPSHSSWGVDAAVGENNACCIGVPPRLNLASYPLDGANGASLGEAYLWLGMDFTPAANQQRGTYTGTANVTVAYFP